MSQMNNSSSSPSTPKHISSLVQQPKRVAAEGNEQVSEEHQALKNDEVFSPMPVSQILPDGTRQFCDSLRPRHFDGTNFGFPENWTVEYRPRTAPEYLGQVDQFFYDAADGKQYRSVAEVERALKRKLPTTRYHLKRNFRTIFGKSSKTRRLGDNPDMSFHVHNDGDVGHDDNGNNVIVAGDQNDNMFIVLMMVGREALTYVDIHYAGNDDGGSGSLGAGDASSPQQ